MGLRVLEGRAFLSFRGFEDSEVLGFRVSHLGLGL